MRLKNKIAIVTGASRGIGKAIAIAFAREGASVTVVGRTTIESRVMPGTIFKTAEEIQALGVKALPVKTDVSDEKGVEVMVQKTLEEFKRIDILVNNAATNRPALFRDMPIEHWNMIIKVNIRGPVLCTKMVLPVMMNQEYGHIINISSVVAEKTGHEPMTGLAYDVSKAALNRFTVGLAEELRGYHIAVNALMPDNTETEGWSYLNPNADRSSWQQPDIWGRYAVFVATQDPSFYRQVAFRRGFEGRMGPHWVGRKIVDRKIFPFQLSEKRLTISKTTMIKPASPKVDRPQVVGESIFKKYGPFFTNIQ
jgi:NAD(P)-dependent dehydrogenase (short-subunit alcohol dehydrogenase family)